MIRLVILYGLALAVVAGALQWLQYRQMAMAFPADISIALLAIGFIGLGIWVGNRLAPRPAPRMFERNEAAIRSIGLTPREYEILALMASGQSNKELARSLGVSPNTIKTHIARLFEKLAVRRRIQAIEKARWLAIIE